MTLLIHIDPQKGQPFHRQITDRIVECVEEGSLSPGERLPSSRKLADTLGVNRSTVCRAYQDLWALGYIESRPGSYSYVRRRAAGIDRVSTDNIPEPGWNRSGTSSFILPSLKIGEETDDEYPSHGLIDFFSFAPDPGLFPLDDFRRHQNRILKKRGRELLQYGDPRGYRPLREFIAKRMRLHGVDVPGDGILITAGAQGGLVMLSHLLTAPGDSVAIENPTYLRALQLLRLLRLEPVGIPMSPQGIDLDSLGQAMKNKKLRFIYTIPNFHNPTGWTSCQESREKLLGLCLEHGVPVVEDGFEEEMKYFGRAVLPIKSMDRDGAVAYLGTFSKVLFPGLRIGWIATTPDLVERLKLIQQVLMLSGNPAAQAALNAFCRSGEYELHLRRMHAVYRRRMETAQKSLAAYLTGLAEWTKPTGGYTIWLKLPYPVQSEAPLTEHIRLFGVNLMPGSGHFVNLPDQVYFRMSIAQASEEAIRKGVIRLAEALSAWDGEKNGSLYNRIC